MKKPKQKDDFNTSVNFGEWDAAEHTEMEKERQKSESLGLMTHVNMNKFLFLWPW